MISPETLRRYPYFATVGADSLKAVAQMAEQRQIAAGTTLFQEGDSADHLFVVQEGEVDIQYTLGSGELRTVDTLVAGDLLVWSSLVKPFKTTTTGTVRRDVKLIAIDASRLRGLCEEDPLIARQLLTQVTQLLAHRLERARIQLATIG